VEAAIGELRASGQGIKANLKSLLRRKKGSGISGRAAAAAVAAAERGSMDEDAESVGGAAEYMVGAQLVGAKGQGRGVAQLGGGVAAEEMVSAGAPRVRQREAD
jgi:hypothetical protein